MFDGDYHDDAQYFAYEWWALDKGGWFAICTYSGLASKLTHNAMTRLVVRDTRVMPETWCEESERCLAVSCPLNKTTTATLAREYRMPESWLTPHWRKASQFLTKVAQNSYTSIEPQALLKRHKIKPKQRWRILSRDRFTCRVCGRTASDGVKLHIDHKTPVILGGTNADSNLWVLCQECNHGKFTSEL